MPRPGRNTTNKYSNEFKATVVRLSKLPGAKATFAANDQRSWLASVRSGISPHPDLRPLNYSLLEGAKDRAEAVCGNFRRDICPLCRDICTCSRTLPVCAICHLPLRQRLSSAEVRSTSNTHRLPCRRHRFRNAQGAWFRQMRADTTLRGDSATCRILSQRRYNDHGSSAGNRYFSSHMDSAGTCSSDTPGCSFLAHFVVAATSAIE